MRKAELKDTGKRVQAETTDHMNGAKGVIKQILPLMAKVLWENGKHTWINLSKLLIIDESK